MAGRLEGKVAFITGAARGQGRAHAVRMAQEGADIIAVDICRQIDSNNYPALHARGPGRDRAGGQGAGPARSSPARPTCGSGRSCATRSRPASPISGTSTSSSPTPASCPWPWVIPHASDFVDATDVDLLGVMNTVAVALPHLPDGGSVIVTGSTAGLMSGTTDNPVMGPGGDGYGWSKKTLVGYSEQMARHLASRFIRVNTIHPTNCNTHLLHNEGLYQIFRPDLENPTREDAEPAFNFFQAMPIPYVEPEDIANLALFLASDESRYITGQQIRVDAGSLLKFPNGPGG